jgi:hypothetical protein
MSTRMHFALAALMITAAWAGQARAASAIGVWKSTSGNVFIIPNNPKEFEIVCKKTDGTKQVLTGKWVEGLVGTQFTYGNGTVTCTFNAKNPDAMRVENLDKDQKKVVTFWVRVSN